jgi:hypothetical protein
LKALLIKGQSVYDVLRLFIDDLAAAFRARGYAVFILDPSAPEDQAALDVFIAGEPVELVFSFGIFGESKDAQGRFIGDMVGAPHIVSYVDYPLSHLTRLEATSPRVGLLMVDESHVAAIADLYPPGRFASLGFGAHAATGATVSPGLDPADFAARRPIRILLPGTFHGEPPAGWRNLQPAVQAIFAEAVERCLATDWLAPLDALDQSMRNAGLDPANPDFAAFRKLAAYVHEQVRTRRRLILLDAVIRLGLPVHVVGGGYDPELERHTSLTLVGPARFDETLALMAGSRVVLNANANFGEGSHERPLCAANAGAVAATDSSSFYAANFEAGAELAIFRWTRLDEDLAAIGALAEDPHRAYAIARAGQRRVVAGHLWEHRIDAIVAAAKVARVSISS